MTPISTHSGVSKMAYFASIRTLNLNLVNHHTVASCPFLWHPLGHCILNLSGLLVIVIDVNTQLFQVWRNKREIYSGHQHLSLYQYGDEFLHCISI